MIVPRYYENLNMLHDNTEPARAYYIPSSNRLKDPAEHREESDRMQLLNGNWKFRYFESIYQVQDAFYLEGYDTSSFDEIPVPGVWQMYDYGRHQYTNIRYPFPFDPPYIPQDIPCGTYVHDFEYQKVRNALRVFLNFEGVDSCFYVWLNGTYVGYSQVAHATSEFDVTSYLKEGKNTIAVLVLKWCDGSYLEDQDKFRMSGIFRDVYLLKRPEKAVRDYRIATRLEGERAYITLELSFTQPTELEVSVEDRYGAAVAEGNTAQNGTLELEIVTPHLWNTEDPYLYTLILKTDDEVITDTIGFRTIGIKDGILYFNGQKIKLRGVNRHDSDPETGFVINIGQYRKDLALMKQHNFNAIRSSHYPNAPQFYQMCDRYGFMVIDEADIEAHGPFMLYRKEDTDWNCFSRWNEKIADNPAWETSILDRVQLMVQRDKNRPCIIMWSMGNESAYGCCFEKALHWTKIFDPDRITQYESARYRNYDVTYNYEDLDLYSRMYPALEEIEGYLEKDGGKPFLLVEYCHSMGNGPGDFEDYFQLIQKEDKMCGGFVWEWCDHAIAHGKAENGKMKYFYGGDHDESIHDGNFCMDGLVYPDRTPHTGLLEYKNVYRPARIVSYNQKTEELVLHNYLDFDDLKDFVQLTYEVTCDGLSVEKGKLPAFSVKPHSDGSGKLGVKVPSAGRTYLRLTYSLMKELPLIPAGHELGFDEILLANTDGRCQKVVDWLAVVQESGRIEVQETDTQVLLKGMEFAYIFDKRTALPVQVTFAGKDYFTHPAELNIWRAPTDNDMYLKLEWKKAHYEEAYTRAYDMSVQQNHYGVQIQAHASVVAPTVQKLLDVEIFWKIDYKGGIQAELSVVKDAEFPDLPRFGVRLFFDQKLEEAAWYGMGPQESYRDKHRGTFHGLFRQKVRSLHEDYLYPQENGSHYDCDFVELFGAKCGIAVASEERFSFNVSVYTQEELEAAAHNYELVESDSTVLCLDYALNGIGSNSCGPVVRDAYRFKENQFTFRFKLMPFNR